MFKNDMRPIHSGEILLADYLKHMGVNVRSVTTDLHVPYARFNEILKSQRSVTANIEVYCQ